MQAFSFFQKQTALLFGLGLWLAAQPLLAQPTATKPAPFCGSAMSGPEMAAIRAIAKTQKAALANKAENAMPATLYAPVQFHLVHNDDGEGVTDLDLAQALVEANLKFAPTNVQFFECSPPKIIGSNYWFNTEFQFGWDRDCSSDTPEFALDEAYRVPDVVNIYCVNTDGPSWSSGPGTNEAFCWDWIVFNQDHVGISFVLAHELGHFFGLPHTFGNLDENKTRDPDDPCYNCETAGDGFCDTPADHHDNVNAGWLPDCLAEAVFDICGVEFLQPDGDNIMSYSDFNCPAADRHFSQEQRDRVYYVMGNDRSYLNCPSDCENDLVLDDLHPNPYTYRSGSFIESTGAVFWITVVYQAETEVRLMPGFEALEGCTFRAIIADCWENATGTPPADDRFSAVKTVEPPAGFSMKAAPNPFDDELNLTILLTEKNTRLRARLLDLSGRVVQILADETVEEPQVFSIKRPVGELPPGIYFVEYGANAVRGVLKLVKM